MTVSLVARNMVQQPASYFFMYNTAGEVLIAAAENRLFRLNLLPKQIERQLQCLLGKKTTGKMNSLKKLLIWTRADSACASYCPGMEAPVSRYLRVAAQL